METCFFQAAALVEKAILQERPKSVLEISAFGCAYGRLIADCRERMRRDEPILIDRVDLLAGAQVIPEGLYRQVTGPEILDTPHALPAYDLILITDLLESVAPADARTLIEILSNKARQQILAITPEYPYAFSDGVPARASFRAYHPAFFFGMDFSYMKLNCLPSPRQFFSIFPPPDVPVTAGNLEPAPASQRKNPLTIACVPPPWDEDGKAEAFYRTFHALALSGHKVTVLTRPQNAEGYVFPETENPLPCTVVPPWQPYAPHAAGADVIVTGRAEDVSGFAAAEKPVVLWELSDKALYGDYGAPIFSADLVRKQRAAAYRRPDHLLCASAALQQTLRRISGRDAYIVPLSVSPLPRTDRRRPAEPVVLMAGAPSEDANNFSLVVKILDQLKKLGAAFTALWAYPARLAPPADSPAVRFVPFRGQEGFAVLCQEADVFLSVRLYDAFPLLPLVAMAAGAVVVASDCGGIREYARPGENCLLSEPGDASSLAAAVAFAFSPATQTAMAEAGARAAAAYPLEHSAQVLAGVLTDVVWTHRGKGKG